MSIKHTAPLTHTESLPHVGAVDVSKEGWIICPNCKERHGLFYRRDSKTKRSLHYVCDRVKHYWCEILDGRPVEHMKLVTRMGSVDFVDGLPVAEEWTAKQRKSFQNQNHDDLLPMI